MTFLRTSLLLAFLLGCGAAEGEREKPGPVASSPTAAEGPAPVRVELERVETARLRAQIAASGALEARRVTEVGTEVPGRIVAVLVDVGDTVAEGAPLFRIDPGPYRMALAEAEAGLSLAQAESENAQQEAARLRLLLDQNAASQQRYDQLRTRAEVARAQVAQGKARLAKVQRDLAQTEVRAPYAGSVVERRAHEGAMAGSSPILVLQESGALEAILNVPEATPVPVRVGDPVRLFVEGLADPVEAKHRAREQPRRPGHAHLRGARQRERPSWRAEGWLLRACRALDHALRSRVRWCIAPRCSRATGAASCCASRTASCASRRCASA